MEPYIIYMLVALAGGVFSTLVPYILKAWEDSSIKFDVTYFYSLCISTFIAVIALIPDTNVVDVKTMMIVFLAALGMNTLTHKGNTVIKKRNGG